MRVAIIGSRNLTINNLQDYLPKETTEIISGGAEGIDSCAKDYALKNKINLTEFLPQYSKYGRKAPLVRNMDIIRSADIVLAFWDGKSRGTKYVIDNCKKLNVPVRVYMPIR